MNLSANCTSTDTELRLASHIGGLSQGAIDQLSQTFRSNHVAVIDQLLPKDMVEALTSEANILLDRESKRRKLTIKESGNTPRAYSSVGRDAICQHDGIIPAIFNSDAVLSFLRKLAGENIERVPYRPEEYIINSQCEPGDTHGWHWDDYAYALIFVIEAPDPLLGGRVEYLSNVEWQKGSTEPYLRRVLQDNVVRSLYVNSGHCYFMKANTTLHRVAPLTGSTKRTVVVLTFASPEDMVSDSITHNSMEDIYPDDTRSDDATVETANVG
ncbi:MULTISPECIES: hypothetical protein [unclassified Bradyrhizobium]|uniref:HalD/BesD family halogenase n=1 Tax=unclassified Bradyrhizobium TaxID=2631580 RepID=UPI002916B4B6|nr:MULTISPECIES: hypothetical protein [unclassified Bradyrhizobium]